MCNTTFLPWELDSFGWRVTRKEILLWKLTRNSPKPLQTQTTQKVIKKFHNQDSYSRILQTNSRKFEYIFRFTEYLIRTRYENQKIYFGILVSKYICNILEQLLRFWNLFCNPLDCLFRKYVPFIDIRKLFQIAYSRLLPFPKALKPNLLPHPNHHDYNF